VPQNIRQKHATQIGGMAKSGVVHWGCRPLQHVAFALLPRYIVSTAGASISRQIQHTLTLCRPKKIGTRKTPKMHRI